MKKINVIWIEIIIENILDKRSIETIIKMNIDLIGQKQIIIIDKIIQWIYLVKVKGNDDKWLKWTDMFFCEHDDIKGTGKEIIIHIKLNKHQFNYFWKNYIYQKKYININYYFNYQTNVRKRENTIKRSHFIN